MFQEGKDGRVIVLVDMDCFYCQVEQKLNPELVDKPIAVVQYNPWKGGGIIAVNYEARAMGVTRGMRGDEAKEKCPEIQLPSVPCLRGKADISKYRDAGKEVAKVLQKFTTLLERASIDEAYLDITIPVQERLNRMNINTVTKNMLPNTFALGYENVNEFISDVNFCSNSSIDFDYEHAKQLLVGAVIVSEIRNAVYEETGYRCSAGIAHNKILAKLVCGMNKPNKQTVLPKHCINILYKTLPVKKVKHMGGKFGQVVCERLKISNMGDLQKFTEKELQAKFDEKNGTWLYNIARGIDLEPVQSRINPKSIGCCKQLRGKSALNDLESLKKWLRDLGDEIEDRLEKDALDNNRTPRQMVVSFSTQHHDGRDTSSSRSYNFLAGDDLCGDFFSMKALELFMESAEGTKPIEGEESRKLKAPVVFLGISVGKFEDHSESKKVKKILDYFGAGPSKDLVNNENLNDSKHNKKQNDKEIPDVKNNNGKEYLLRKFLQISERDQNIKNNKESVSENDKARISKKDESSIETDLHKQESFFAKFLNKTNKDTTESTLKISRNSSAVDRPTTPVCKVIPCGDDSNDTEYSGSTINNEIDKSIALFEEDPQDIERVSKMRVLLNTSNIIEAEDDSGALQSDLQKSEIFPEITEIRMDGVEINPLKSGTISNNVHEENEHISCPECKKIISLVEVATHADFHLALKLRQEERDKLRSERKAQLSTKPLTKNKEQKTKPEDLTIKTESSLSSFLIKINDKILTERCTECGKKIPMEKVPEHLDFHEAQKLNRQLNKKHLVATPKENTVKRKRKSTSPAKKLKVPCKSIESFFR